MDSRRSVKRWFAWSIVDCESSDGCTGWLDIWFGKRYFIPCIQHDIGNRTGEYPGKGKIKKQRDLDIYFLGDLMEQTWDDVTKRFLLIIPHLIILFLSDLLVWSIVRLTHRFWYKHPNDN